MAIAGQIVSLESIQPNLVAKKAYSHALRVSKDKEKFDRGYADYEWGRKTYVMQRLAPANSILDVGVGRGYFVNMLKWSKKFERVCGVDIVDHRPSRFAHGVEFMQMDVTNLKFENQEFDCITCMEVLEHLRDDQLVVALDELRRVAKKQLLVSVPFREPMPLPPYHLQQFDEEKLIKLFPNGKFSLLLKARANRTPWMVISEKY